MPIFKQKLRESIDTIKTFLQEKNIVFSYTLIRKEQKFKLKKSLSAISGEKISQRQNIKITFIFLIIEKFENN